MQARRLIKRVLSPPYNYNPVDDADLCLATLVTTITYLQSTVYHNLSEFCQFVQPSSPDPGNYSCPLSPGAHAFGFDVVLNSDYVFGTIVPTIQVLSVDVPPIQLVCLSFELTPRFTTALDVTFSIVPLAVALLVGFASLFAAILNPWTGTWNLLRATSNVRQDPDTLRLVTPGFSDALNYIQFAVFTACLSLDYPGFYQPVLSRAAWSNLLFNTTLLYPSGNGTLSWSTTSASLAGHVDPSPPTLINIVNGSDFGLTRYASLVGISGKEVWPTFMVWFLLVLAGVTVLTEIGFAISWAYKQATRNRTSDFGATQLCFLGGMLIRVWSLFYIVLVTTSCYQFVVAGESPAFQVGLSVIVLVFLGVVAPLVLIWVISRYKMEHLFEDFHVLLGLGPLYNTYEPEKVMFVAFVFVIRLVQGIVVGAAQASGIAQITLLASLELMFLLGLNIWRPFRPRTSMNGWHTFVGIMRLMITLFLIAFIPSLGVDAGVRGWIGYTLLVLHGVVLIFIFLLNVIQTIIEVTARQLGAGEESARREREFGLVNVFGINQLMRRANSQRQPAHLEYAEDNQEPKQGDMALAQRRSSSQGTSSYGLMETQSYLSRGSTTPGATPIALYGDRRNTTSPVSPSAYGYIPRGGPLSPTNGSNNGTLTVPTSPTTPDSQRTQAFYRQPRRSVLPPLSPITSASRFDPNVERENIDTAVRTAFNDSLEDVHRPKSRTASPRPASRTEQRPPPNYAVREVDDYYYRRPDYTNPLNTDSTARRLGTGPADPTGPVAVATSWFNRIFSRNPDKGKFEVVRGNAARTEIPLTENTREMSRPSSAGKGDDVRSPLVSTDSRILEDENEDVIGERRSSEDISSPLPIIPELDVPNPTMDILPPSQSQISTLMDAVEEEDLDFPSPPPKNPQRGSISSVEDLPLPGPPPSIPRKSSARMSPRIRTEIPWQSTSDSERIREVRTGRPIWTEHNLSSRESVGQIHDSEVEGWSDEE